MIDSVAAQLALRNRAIAVVIATTGSATLSATATGYARAAGSFLTDGFAVGMEITLVTGFAVAGNNQAVTVQGRVITGVTASAISCTGCAVDAANSGRVITAGLPFLRAWENTVLTPVAGFPYVEEDFVPATSRLLSAPASNGELEETGIYFLKLYGLSGKGISALRKSADALVDLFTPGTKLTAGSHTVRVRTDIGPRVGELLPLDSGWTVATLSVPWFAYSVNTIAA